MSALRSALIFQRQLNSVTQLARQVRRQLLRRTNGLSGGGGGGLSGVVWRGGCGHGGYLQDHGYQQCRDIHSSYPEVRARFKLKIEKKSAGVTEEETEDKQEEDDKEEGYLKSHPYRKLQNVWRTRSDLCKHLIDNVIHNDHGLFVTNKPFGVGVRDPSPQQLQRRHLQDSLHLRGLPSCPYTLENLLPDLRHLLDKPNLVLVRSTEKLTSGPAVFAEDPETGDRFRKCVAGAKVFFDVLYRYHVITTLPPFLMTGGNDPSKIHRYGITVKKAVGSDLGQPVLLRDYSINSVKRREVTAVHVRSSLLHAGESSSGGYLVEVNTSTAQNNFLRIYCADKLAPILGDHLYSGRVQTLKGIPVKIDPTHLTPGSGYQKISGKMMEALELKGGRPEESLMIPTHVHLKGYQIRKWIRGAPGGRHEVIRFEAPYPPHFRWTCQRLGIILDEDAQQINN